MLKFKTANSNSNTLNKFDTNYYESIPILPLNKNLSTIDNDNNLYHSITRKSSFLYYFFFFDFFQLIYKYKKKLIIIVFFF